MYKIISIIASLLLSPLSFADDHVWTTYTGEVLQCNLNDGKNVEDVLGMVKKDWYALNYPVPYDAWVTTPTLYAANDGSYDLFWVGFTSNNADMGSSLDWFNQNGTRVFSKWQNLVNCSSWSHWDIWEAREPSSSLEEGDTNIWAFHSCKFKKRKSPSDFKENDEEWNEFFNNIEHTGGVWRWWPAGGSDVSVDSDFYINVSFSSMNEYGKYRDARKQAMSDGSLPELITDCEAPRVYTANNIKVMN
jgi:hypothetical protein